MDPITILSNPNSEADAAARAAGTTQKPLLPAPEAAELISAAALKNFVEGPEYLQQPCTFSPILIIDVRPYAQYAAGHIRGAIQMTLDSCSLKRLERGCFQVACLVNERHRLAFNQAHKSSTIVFCDGASLLPPATLDVVVSRLRPMCQGVQFLEGGVKPFLCANAHLLEATKACPLSLALPKLCGSIVTPPASPLAPACEMAQILPFLYLGNREDAHNLATLNAHNIRYVLNITEDCPNVFEREPGFVYKRIAIPDSCSQNIRSFFDEAFEFINKAKTSGASVLVHCMAGISRSTTIVVAYLMASQHLTMNSAYESVKSKRPIVSPNLSFMGQLLQFQEEISTTGDGFKPTRCPFAATVSKFLTARS